MSQWILCKSWWPPKKGQRGKFSKLWLLGILGSSDHLGPAAPRLMALTTLMSGMFWGMTRAVVQTTMHFQSLDLRMWHGARRSGKSGKSGTLRSPMVTWGERVVLGGSTFFFVLKASWLTFLAMGKTRISISKRMFFLKITAHGDSLYLMNLVTDRYTMNVFITILFFEEGFHFFQFSS